MSDRDGLKDVLASNVNEEVLVFRGSTTGELMGLAGVSAAVLVPASLIVGLLLGKGALFMSLSLPVVFASVFVSSSLMAAFKRGRPDGVITHRMQLLQHKWKIKPSQFVVENGPMSVRRTTQTVMIDASVESDDG